MRLHPLILNLEPTGFEPVTFWLPVKRSPNWTTAPENRVQKFNPPEADKSSKFKAKKQKQ